MTDHHLPSPAQAPATDIGSGHGGWDNATLPIDGYNFPVQHAWVIGTYGKTSHAFPCFGGPQGAECYPGTSYCANPAQLLRLSDLTPSASTSVDIDMVLAILVCTGIKTTDPYKWRLNYDCTTNTGCHPSDKAWVMGDSSGIWYGLTGVCHQAANRILAASNGCTAEQCSIDPARTVAMKPLPTGILSWLTYGPLGLDIDIFWLAVQDRYTGRLTERAQDLEERMMQLHFARSTDIALRQPVISRFILNDPDAGAVDAEAVEEAIKAYLLDKLDLDSDLVTGAAHPHAFAIEVNRRATELLKRLGEIAGEAWYRKYAFPGAVLNFACPLWMGDADIYRRFAHLAPARSRR